jgi:hypothetical protein
MSKGVVQAGGKSPPFRPVRNHEITGPRGGGTGTERTITRGEPMPPTPESGQKYRLVDQTRHKSGR